MISGCCFCDEYLHPRDSQYYLALGQSIGVDSRIVLETEHWYAVPSLGCLTAGHLLLVCKRHYPGAASLPEGLYLEMLELKSAVEAVVYGKTGLRCLAFEHGTTSASYRGANSVDHVHLHVLPFARDLWSEISKTHELQGFLTVAGYRNLFSVWSNHRPETYLLFQDLNRRIFYRPDARGFPSQFFRKCLAPYFQVKEWDWRRSFNQEAFLETIGFFK